ncbi:LOW QUALITY PROTEIN: protein Wnt-16, partial [Menidia menidia]
WLGVASLALPEPPPLTPGQRALCGRRPFLLDGVRDGARLALSECRRQFRHERWNCSGPGAPPGLGPQLTSGTRETAFIQAVVAAGLVHAVTRACSHGNVTACGCDARRRGGGVGGAEGWTWGGCSDHIRYGTWFSRRFMDPPPAPPPNATRHGAFTMDAMRLHNSEAGRQAVERTMSTDCRCHGVSGSCAVKTCWRTMAPFQRVGAYLKERYERSVHVGAPPPPPAERRPGGGGGAPVGRHQLVHLHKSPNYCVADAARGVAGTAGRRCGRAAPGPGGCGLLCCGRGYNTHLERHTQRCHCKFVWCCYVHCRRCESMNHTHTCK